MLPKCNIVYRNKNIKRILQPEHCMYTKNKTNKQTKTETLKKNSKEDAYHYFIKTMTHYLMVILKILYTTVVSNAKTGVRNYFYQHVKLTQ